MKTRKTLVYKYAVFFDTPVTVFPPSNKEMVYDIFRMNAADKATAYSIAADFAGHGVSIKKLLTITEVPKE